MSIDSMIDKCVEEVGSSFHNLSPWECEFIKGIGASNKQYGGLTDRQERKLREIWDKIS